MESNMWTQDSTTTNKSTDKESSTISKGERDSWDMNLFKTQNLGRPFLRRRTIFYYHRPKEVMRDEEMAFRTI